MAGVLLAAFRLLADAGRSDADRVSPNLYPEAAGRVRSAGNTAYFIDPNAGNDTNSGLKAEQAWRTFSPLNARLLAPGDRVEILAPGSFQETFMPMGAGTPESPVEIHFAPGRFDFFPTRALKRKLHISNANDKPYDPKAIAWLLQQVKHFRISGSSTDFFVHGKMVEVMLDHAEDVTLSGLRFDYQRPTVSEFTVLAVASDYADVQVHPDSTYAVENGKLAWIGEGWRSAGLDLSQEYDPADERVWRRSSPLAQVTSVQEMAPFRLRLFFQSNPGLSAGRVLQFRDTLRDCVGVFALRSRDVVWRNDAFYFLHGLGIVSQFSENVTFDHVVVAPRPGSGRTCAGWADLLHFSGCRGLIEINDCELAGTNDDPLNVHGTHLRVCGRPGGRQLLLRFMHSQSFGFEAFIPDDEIELVDHQSLLAYHTNRVESVEARSDKEVLLTLREALPAAIGENDVVENVTWTPSVEVRRCRVSRDSCRGFLVSTRRPVLIENNTFIKTSMPAILIADDANSWFESGPVRDVVIRGNRFQKCAEPVIDIAPENRVVEAGKPVHQNIRIVDNDFALAGHCAVAARSAGNLVIQGNRFSYGELPVQTTACTNVISLDNELSLVPQGPLADRPSTP